MSTTIKTGWLNDNNGDKFAPKTLSSQVITADGIILEDKIQSDIDEAIAYADNAAAQKSQVQIIKWGDDD